MIILLGGLVNAVSNASTSLYCDVVANFISGSFYAPSASVIPFFDTFINNPLKNLTKEGYNSIKGFAGFLAFGAFAYLVWAIFAKVMLKETYGRNISTGRIVAVLLAFLFLTAVATEGYAFIQNIGNGSKDSFVALTK